MKKLLSRGIKKLASLLQKISVILESGNNTASSIQAARVQPWFNDNGDATLRLHYPLNTASVVFDVGGYEGQWASDIYSMYNCNILIFEPLPEFYNRIKSRFERNSKIEVYPFGLGAQTETVELSVLDNASSMYGKSGESALVKIQSIIEFLDQNNVSSVDLIKINIEGAEYELLESLLRNGFIKYFKNIQVQFHDFVIPDAYSRMKAIQNRLEKTHKLTYQYEFVWENWQIL